MSASLSCFVSCFPNELWGIYFAGFGIAVIISYIPELSGAALLIVAFFGLAMALNDYQTRIAIKQMGETMREVTRMASNATTYKDLTPAQPLDKKTLNKMVWRSAEPSGIFQL